MPRFPNHTSTIDLTNLFRFVLSGGTDATSLTIGALAKRFGSTQAVMRDRVVFLESEGILDPDIRTQTGRTGTYHWDTISEALGVLEQALKVRTPPTKTASPKKETTMNVKPSGTCYCGCKTKTGPKAVFAPGHDARFVSNAVMAFTFEFLTQGWSSSVTTAEIIGLSQEEATLRIKAITWPSDALRNKAIRAFTTAIKKTVKAHSKATASPTRLASHEWAPSSPVKIGRWEYPTRTSADGKVTERNSKRDGTGEWLPI